MTSQTDTYATITLPARGDLLIGMGDFHGHYPALETLLGSLDTVYQIFENKQRLILKDNVTLVCTGDYIDRGESSLKVIDTFKKLARKNPGRVVTLTGNHELMALADLDCAREALKETASQDPNDYYTRYTAYGAGGSLHGYNGGIDFIKEFGSNPEEALRNYVKRMSKEGDVGRWMRKLKPCALMDFEGTKVLFTHADVPVNAGTASTIRVFAKQYREHMRGDSETLGGTQNKYGDKTVVRGRTIFWNRGFSEMRPEDIDQMVANLGVDYLVVGHTPHRGITPYSLKVFDIDVGMTPRYGENEPAALVFKKEGVYGFYSKSGEQRLR